MNPTDQIGSALSSWTDAQKRLWEGWMNVYNKATELNVATPESADWLKRSTEGSARAPAKRRVICWTRC